MIKKYIKRIIPNSIKEYIKKQIEYDNHISDNVKYDINITDLVKHTGKCILVTGATGSIGSAITYLLYLEGATVGVCGRDGGRVEALIQKIKAFDSTNIGTGALIPVIIDVMDEESIDKGIDGYVLQTGRLDVLINNAGGSARENNDYLHMQSSDIIDQVLNTNLRGTILCSRKATQIMIQQKKGIIINMASVVGMCGKEKMSDYAAAKAGVIGFTKSLAIELGKWNIQVNCVSPGMVNQKAFDRGLPRIVTNKNSLKRFGVTDEVARLISFLISDDASYITGQNFVIDGGRSLGLMGDTII